MYWTAGLVECLVRLCPFRSCPGAVFAFATSDFRLLPDQDALSRLSESEDRCRGRDETVRCGLEWIALSCASAAVDDELRIGGERASYP